MPPSLGSTHLNSTVSATTTATTTSAPPCLCKQGGEKAAPPFGHGSGEVHIWRRMGGAVRMGVTSQAPLPPFACRGAMQTPRVGCPSLHPFPLPHAPHWGCYNRTTLLTQIHRTASFSFILTPFTVAHVRYDLATCLWCFMYNMIWRLRL